MLVMQYQDLAEEKRLTNSGPASSCMGWPIVAVQSNNDTDDDHANAHDNRTNDKHWLAANFVNDELKFWSVVPLARNVQNLP